MKKGKWMMGKVIGIALTLAFIGTMVIGIPALIYKVEASPTTIYVPDDYTTIQAAVDAVNPGDTIIVRDGTYTENVNVNKDHLTIQSENGPEATTVQAADHNHGVFEVFAGYVTINGFTAKGATAYDRAAIHLLLGSHSCTISNNIASDNQDGISLRESTNNVILFNHTKSNSGCGVILGDQSKGNTIYHNTADANGWAGIHMWLSPNNNVFENTVDSNPHYGLSLDRSSNNTIYLNNFSNNLDNVYSSASTNLWNSPEEMTYTYGGNNYTSYLGNYWSDYEDRYPSAGEIDSSGVWDTPYGIDSDSDNYPLIEPFENYGNDVPLPLSKPFLHFPLSGKTPWNAPINAVFDHSMSSPYSADNVTHAYTGERGEREFGADFVTTLGGVALYGFRMDYSGTSFTVNGNYTGEAYLYYDGHPGYDFRTIDQGTNVSVLASAAGTAYRGNADWGVVYVYHASGYRTAYLHLVNESRIADGTKVTAGQQIGIAGDTGGAAVHLHFEVRKNVNGQWVPVDPYGWHGSGTDPYFSETEVENINLWLEPMPSPEPPPDSPPTQDGCGSQTVTLAILVPIIGYGVRKIRSSRSKA